MMIVYAFYDNTNPYVFSSYLIVLFIMA